MPAFTPCFGCTAPNTCWRNERCANGHYRSPNDVLKEPVGPAGVSIYLGPPKDEPKEPEIEPDGLPVYEPKPAVWPTLAPTPAEVQASIALEEHKRNEMIRAVLDGKMVLSRHKSHDESAPWLTCDDLPDIPREGLSGADLTIIAILTLWDSYNFKVLVPPIEKWLALCKADTSLLTGSNDGGFRTKSALLAHARDYDWDSSEFVCVCIKIDAETYKSISIHTEEP